MSEEFLFRLARPDDREEVLAFTAHTWEFGDYIEHVFDHWLADPTGKFLVAEERTSGRIAAIDKLTFLSPQEAWFEGLRVHPDFRGRGLAASLQTYMIQQAREAGAQTVRFLTLVGNLPVHHMAYRDGFSRQFTVRFCKWEDKGEPPAPEPLMLRRATRDEAPTLYDWWMRSSAHATGGLVHHHWSLGSSSPEEWAQDAEKGHLFVPNGLAIDELTLPPATALVSPESDEGKAVWALSTASAPTGEWAALMSGLIECARSEGIKAVHGLMPDSVDVFNGLKAAGLECDTDDERLCLFSLALDKNNQGSKG